MGWLILFIIYAVAVGLIAADMLATGFLSALVWASCTWLILPVRVLYDLWLWAKEVRDEKS